MKKRDLEPRDECIIAVGVSSMRGITLPPALNAKKDVCTACRKWIVSPYTVLDYRRGTSDVTTNATFAFAQTASRSPAEFVHATAAKPGPKLSSTKLRLSPAKLTNGKQ